MGRILPCTPSPLGLALCRCSINICWLNKRIFARAACKPWPSRQIALCSWVGGGPWVGLFLLLLANPPPPPQVREDFAPCFPHRPAFFLCHYHPVKQRGQSGSIWITLTIAYYLGQNCPHSPPPAPTAAVAGPLGTQLPPPPPLVSQGLQGTS